MTLLTDGGSTKCDWVLLDDFGKVVFKTSTPGLNPTVVHKEELSLRISANDFLRNVFTEVNTVDFYGAGCGTSTPRAILKEVLEELFPNAKVSVYEDLAAAVFSVTEEPAIICIIGTGSNSCYFDGEKIHAPIPALGYMVMDEASGNYYGKRLLRDYYYKRMPPETAWEFSQKYNLDADTIKMNLYKKPNPNAYLASFAEFIFSQKPLEVYFHNLVKEGIHSFVESRILSFSNAPQLPIHFIGSIAFLSQDIIAECLLEKDLQMGKVLQRPIDGLIDYYRRKIVI